MAALFDPDPETTGWLRLARCPGLSPREAAELGRTHGAAAFARGAPAALLAAGSLQPEAAARLDDAALSALVEAERDRAQRGGWTLLHLTDPRYPANLAQIAAPPVLLTVLGELAALADPAVAIVGSRYPSGYGLRLAEELAGGLARLGLVIVSGLAQGIDAAAHRAALAAGGRTVAVMGTGMDRVYPRHHGRLARDIARRGALATEFPPGVPPLAGHFPRRNRILAALADAVVVVEAKQRSGALITARHASDFSRPVLAVPGRAGEPLAFGPLSLLRDGAAIACTASDVLLELPPTRLPSGLAAVADQAVGLAQVPAAAAGPVPDPTAAAILALLPRDDERGVDELLEEADLPPDEVLAALFTLELAGLVDALPGGAYRRARRVPGGGASGGRV